MNEIVLDPGGTADTKSLRVGSVGHRASGWWGMMTLILTEGLLFAYLLFTYFYLAANSDGNWLPDELPSFKLSGPNTLILIASSVAVWFGERGAKRGSRAQLVIGLAVGFCLGTVFTGIQIKEWIDKPFSLAAHSYGSTYFTITGFHMAHVAAGLLMLGVLTLWSVMGYFDRRRLAPVSIGAVYWHFVDVVWLAVFFTFYVTPYLR